MNKNPIGNAVEPFLLFGEPFADQHGVAHQLFEGLGDRRLGHAEAAGDLGLQKAAADTTAPNGRLTEKQLLARAADWSPWRGYAALLLWNSLSNKVTA